MVDILIAISDRPPVTVRHCQFGRWRDLGHWAFQAGIEPALAAHGTVTFGRDRDPSHDTCALRASISAAAHCSAGEDGGQYHADHQQVHVPADPLPCRGLTPEAAPEWDTLCSPPSPGC